MSKLIRQVKKAKIYRPNNPHTPHISNSLYQTYTNTAEKTADSCNSMLTGENDIITAYDRIDENEI